MSRQRKADLLLVLATAFWGVSYYLLDLCLTELQPLTLNAFRFLTAFFVLGAIFFRKLRGLSRRTLLASIPIGLCLVLTYIGCTYGVLYTSLSNAGFICALPVVVSRCWSGCFCGSGRIGGWRWRWCCVPWAWGS